jgi:hypothetical protein
MPKTSKVLFVVAGALTIVTVLVVAYIWIGSQVFGINTSRLDPAQGPSWPFQLIYLSIIGTAICAVTAAVVAVASRLHRSRNYKPGRN